MDDIRARFPSVRYPEGRKFDMILRRGITPAQIAEAINSPEAEIIEHYPDDPRGPSCLVLGWCGGARSLHIVIGLSEPPKIITAWDPSVDPRDRWEPGFRRRRRETENDG